MAKMQLTLYAACKDGNDVLTALHNVFQKEIKEVKEENKNISFLLHTQTKIDMEVCGAPANGRHEQFLCECSL